MLNQFHLINMIEKESMMIDDSILANVFTSLRRKKSTDKQRQTNTTFDIEL